MISIFGILSIFVRSRVNSLMVCIVTQASRREGSVSIPTIPYSDSGTVLFLNTTAFQCKYHSFNTP
jgi:hypothetical protein